MLKIHSKNSQNFYHNYCKFYFEIYKNIFKIIICN